MLKIGCHLSSSKGFVHMLEEALEINGNTFQFFTRNPRGGKAKDIDINDINQFLILKKEKNIEKILAHAPYTLNPCAKSPETLEFALTVMMDDLKRMEYIPNNMYNFHPGNHVGQGTKVGIQKTATLLNNVLTKDQTTTILIETMSGKGTEIGKTFQELRDIIGEVSLQDKVGICLDTCHIYDGGYDIINNLDGVLDEFNELIGLDKLMAIHLNDSLNLINSHKDRHAKINHGSIGLNALVKIINHPKLCDLPFILETPNELDGYAYEIKLFQENYNK
ncbi:deoxyribonuclease IV [Fusobacterium sp. PH5-44]|uniref:deoxyribonuclease IV n=1 Tax=unclassified Fusobacterium TaxID=2648384 RepID=UPI003D1E2E95